MSARQWARAKCQWKFREKANDKVRSLYVTVPVAESPSPKTELSSDCCFCFSLKDAQLLKIASIKTIHLSFERILKYKIRQQPAGNLPAFPAGNPLTAVLKQQLLFSFSHMANTSKGLVSGNSHQQHQQKYPSASQSAAITTGICSQTFVDSTSCYKHICFSSCPAPSHFLTFPTPFLFCPFCPDPSIFHKQKQQANKLKTIQGISRDEINSFARMLYAFKPNSSSKAVFQRVQETHFLL